MLKWGIKLRSETDQEFQRRVRRCHTCGSSRRLNGSRCGEYVRARWRRSLAVYIRRDEWRLSPEGQRVDDQCNRQGSESPKWGKILQSVWFRRSECGSEIMILETLWSCLLHSNWLSELAATWSRLMTLEHVEFRSSTCAR
jgi:hypothetical protein